MVALIPGILNPTRAEIDDYIVNNRHSLIVQNTRRQIECKSAVGALLHPAEEYFLDVVNKL
jgi:hypothetical protein